MLAENRWILNDLEWANTIDSEIGEHNPAHHYLPPELVGIDGEWTAACDMWQFGRLLSSWGQLDSQGEAYVRLPNNETPGHRLDSLDHPFFRLLNNALGSSTLELPAS